MLAGFLIESGDLPHDSITLQFIGPCARLRGTARSCASLDDTAAIRVRLDLDGYTDEVVPRPRGLRTTCAPSPGHGTLSPQ